MEPDPLIHFKPFTAAGLDQLSFFSLHCFHSLFLLVQGSATPFDMKRSDGKPSDLNNCAQVFGAKTEHEYISER